mmetsp:Transcript_25605/g.59637  ORF Transcript_25605/g.59637 Transcript_25605/m.59637 type:complete len:98 (+) Transcript_25605:359-652(+)
MPQEEVAAVAWNTGLNSNLPMGTMFTGGKQNLSASINFWQLLCRQELHWLDGFVPIGAVRRKMKNSMKKGPFGSLTSKGAYDALQSVQVAGLHRGCC